MVVCNILDLIDEMGEDGVKNILSNFYCTINPEIQGFINNNAIDFAKKKVSITYLFMDDGLDVVFAIYSITHKVIEIDITGLSNNLVKQIKKFAEIDNDGKCTASAFLIAQFGKSDKGQEKSIDGNDLMNAVIYHLKEIQHEIGGKIVYLECENKPKLLKFYKENGFVLFGERQNQNDGILYEQLLDIL